MKRLSTLALLCALLCPPASPGDLERVLHDLFVAKRLEEKKFRLVRWVDGGAGYTVLQPEREPRDLIRYETASGGGIVLVPAARRTPPGAQEPLAIDDYAWSADGKRLLIFTNSRKVWRRNTRGDYWVLHPETGALRKLGGPAAEPSTLMFAKFSPDGRRAAYVRANNLYVEDLESGAIRALTSDGSSSLINGTSDWVNEEELDIRDAFRWSPDGRAIAFWQFDTSEVRSFPLINNTDGLYPVIHWIRYPKAGTTNSAVRAGVVDVTGGPVRWLRTPGDPRNTYLARMEWAASSSELVLQQLNRLQNVNDVLLADARTGEVRRVFRDEDQAWVDVVDEILWTPEGKEFVWLSERDGWRRAWVIPRDGRQVRAVTPPNADAIELVRVDGRGEWLYYIASPANATQRYLYRARLDGSGRAERVTPQDQPGTHTYELDPSGEWAFHTWSAFDRPPATDLVRLPAHESVRPVADNRELREAAAFLLGRPTEFFRLDIGGGVTLDGWMMRPPNFQPSEKYPLLLYVYGEPARTAVNDRWEGARALFHRGLATEGYVVACVDNRGTPAPKGREWRKIIYGSVGVLSSQEQTAAVRALLKTRPYLDPDRVAVWGWSGGGSNTLNLMFRSPEVFKAGMAVAPVPDQRLYDTIYQERYMGLPQDNPEGYRLGSPISFAQGLRGRLLIIHGTGDDNVHYQGTELLVNRLIQLGKPFDMMAYPNRSHSLSEGEGTLLHLYRLLARYLMEHVPPGPRSRQIRLSR